MKFKRLLFPTLAGIALAGLILFGFANQTMAREYDPGQNVDSHSKNGLNNILSPQDTTWYVNAATGNDGNDCLSSVTACATIGAALGKTAANDTIEIAAGTYLEHDLEINHQLTLNGAGSETTIVDANAAGRAFRIGGEVLIAGLRLQNGQTQSGNIFDEGGGAVLVSGGGHLTLQNMLLVENQAVGSGGAIFNVGNLLLENTQVLSNTAAGGGGGIYNYNLGIITVTNSTLAYNISNGSGVGGGAIYAGGQSLTIQDSTLADNYANYFGGGVDATLNGPVILEGVTLSGNQAVGGAGIFSANGALTLTNTTVSGNNATNNYGGIYISGPSTSLLLQNSTIAYNTRTSSNGTGFNGLMVGNSAVAQMNNTLLAYNQSRNCASSQPPTSLGYNLSSDFHCGLTQSGDQQGVDPLLGSLGENGGPVQTHALLPGSPAIDAGDPVSCPLTDARGITRPYDGDGDSLAVCDIGAVEARHQISIADYTLLEGDSGSVTAAFTVTLAPTSTATVSVDFVTVDDTATGGLDYTITSDTLIFNPGETEKYINISIIGDTNDELNETFEVQLSNPVNADLLDAQATGTIVDDDGLPTLSIASQSLLEGNSGTTVMQFTVTLSPASNATVTVDYATADGTATAGSDYVSVGDTLTFQPGETSQTFSVDILGDLNDEGLSEFFTAQLSDPNNAALADGEAAGTITDDDEARLSHTFGPQVLEGDSGLTPAVFTVTLSTPADFVITVDYAVSSGYGVDGAKEGEDFLPASGTLTFQPGDTVMNYIVQIIGDTLEESDESYNSLISNATVPISVNGSLAKILNDDNFRIYLPWTVR